MSSESLLSDDALLDSPSSSLLPTARWQRVARLRERRTATIGSEDLLQNAYHTDSELVPPPSPLYYKGYSPISQHANSKGTTSQGSFSSLQRYCSTLSSGSSLNLKAGQDGVPDFVVPRRTTPPRSTRLTSSGELVHYIQAHSSKDYQTLIKDEIDRVMAGRTKIMDKTTAGQVTNKLTAGQVTNKPTAGQVTNKLPKDDE